MTTETGQKTEITTSLRRTLPTYEEGLVFLMDNRPPKASTNASGSIWYSDPANQPTRVGEDQEKASPGWEASVNWTMSE